jgi:putative ubiquitin-RnfH superfamily antitoxin RatB of RatAB toxin-antitoxin module
VAENASRTPPATSKAQAGERDTVALRVEVAYALPDRQKIIAIDVPAGTSAQEAVRRSGIADHFPDIDLGNLKLGIFGKAVAAGQQLVDGDRVEIYRPLIADPKIVRKKRAERAKTKPASPG